MAIWEFYQYEDEDLKKISISCDTLSEYGIEQDDDMIRELNAEIGKREEDEE